VKDNVIYNIIIGSSSAMQVVGKCCNHPTKKKSKARNDSTVTANFLVGSNIVFIDDFWVGSDTVSLSIAELVEALFSLLIFKSTWLCALTSPCVNCGNSFIDDLWVSSNSIFIYDFLVNEGRVHWRIHASTMEAFSLMIFESTSIQFSLMIF